MRFAADSQCRSSISIPTAVKPMSFAARSVEPDPMKGSIMLFGVPAKLIHHFIRSSGFWFECTRFSSFSLACAPFQYRVFNRATLLMFVHAISQSAWSFDGMPSRLSHTSQHGLSGSRLAKWFPPQRITTGYNNHGAGSNGRSSPTMA